METLQSLADALARDALKAADEAGDERIVDEVAKAVGALSTTLQEAYLTQIRMRRAEIRGRTRLNELIEGARKGVALKVTPDYKSDDH